MKTILLFKKIIALAVLAGATLSANAASSTRTITDLGTVSVGIERSFSVGTRTGKFEDFFTFLLPDTTSSLYSAIKFAASNNVLYSVSLFSNADEVLFNSDDIELQSVASPNSGSDQLALSSGPRAAGPYYLQITGNTEGNTGGYTGSIFVTVVPEPETYALLLAGLGLMGAIARRRGRKSV